MGVLPTEDPTLGSSMPPHALLCPPLPCTLSLRWQRTYLVLFADLSAPWTQGQRNALDRRQEPEVSSDICWEAPPRAGKSLQMGSEQMLWTEMVRACGAWRERGWYPSPHWMMWWGTGKGQWSQTMALGLSHPTHRVAGWVLPMWQCVRKLRLTGTWGWDLQSRTCLGNPSLPSASKAESSWLCQTAPRGQVGQGWGLLAAIFPGTACWDSWELHRWPRTHNGEQWHTLMTAWESMFFWMTVFLTMYSWKHLYPGQNLCLLVVYFEKFFCWVQMNQPENSRTKVWVRWEMRDRDWLL